MKMRRWILLDLWVLSLAAISFYGGAVSYGIFYGISFIPVISLVYLAIVYFNLRIYQQIESRDMVCGQPMPYFFVLQNDSLCVFSSVSVNLFSSFSSVEDMPGDTQYELLPGDKRAFETKMTCKYRGEYEVGVKEIIMTDFFRLFRVRYRIPGTIKALVLPKITRVTEIKSIDSLTLLPQRESFREHTEPDIVVRDYITGDSLKQIHWKSTAREQKLKVRGRTGEEKQDICLLWDTRRWHKAPADFLPPENKILETALALGVFIAERNIPFSAYYGQKGLTFAHVHGLQDFDSFYRQVSEVQFDQEESFEELLLRISGQGILSTCKVVFCVLHRLDEAILKLAEQLDQAGTLVVFYLITDENADNYVRQSNERRKIMAIPVDAALEGRL